MIGAIKPPSKSSNRRKQRKQSGAFSVSSVASCLILKLIRYPERNRTWPRYTTHNQPLATHQAYNDKRRLILSAGERTMARVVRFHKVGGPEVLQIEDVPVPPPGKGEVQIKIKAIGLNRAESMFRRGQYLESPKLPARLGYEAAGTVSAFGPGVQGFKIGDVVSTIPSFSQNDYGIYGELAN